MAAAVVFAVFLTLTLVRSILVVDAVTSPPGVSSRFAARASPREYRWTQRRGVPALHRGNHTLQPHHGNAQPPALQPTLHNRLLAMHFVAAAYMIMGTAKHNLPVSTMTCRVTVALQTAIILLYDASLVLFLLAKASVTNGTRTLSRWERCITWWSRFYAWVFLPWLSVAAGLSTPSSVNDEGTHCLSGSSAEGESAEFSDLIGYLINNIIIIAQFVLLLALFVKPMRVPQGSTKSGGAVYRRVVIRNIVCTAGIVLSYTISTCIMILKWLSDGTDMEERQSFLDITPSTNMLLTLFLTEIALPLGLSSCFKSVKATRHQDNNQTRPLVGSTMTTKNQAQTVNGPTFSTTMHQPTRTPVVPMEDDLP